MGAVHVLATAPEMPPAAKSAAKLSRYALEFAALSAIFDIEAVKQEEYAGCRLHSHEKDFRDRS